MKFTAASALLLAAVATAAPSGHAHKNAHRSLEARNDFVMAQKPAPPTAAPAPPAAPAPAPAPAAAPGVFKEETVKAQSTGGSGQGVDSVTSFCGGAKREVKRATLAQIAYAGNVGTPGNYGCNMMLAKSNVAEQYKYVTKIDNVSDQDQECVAYNKIGPDGGINGFFNGNEAIKFTVPAGATQYLVADENTQGGVVCDAPSIPLTGFGQFAGTWTEFDFGNDSNGGWSGADASCLVSAASGMPIPGLNVCGHGTCSTINPGGSGTNAFLGGMEALDGLGLNIPPGNVLLEVTIGFKGL